MEELFEFEYRVVETNECYCASDLEVEISEQTTNNWELLQVIPNPNGCGQYCLILKRLML